MLSKREKLFAAVSDLHGLICPVCRQLLSRQGDNLICAGGHAVYCTSCATSLPLLS